MKTNLLLETDSYKQAHHKMYPDDTEVVYSYFESRAGAQYNETVFFGLQYLLQEYISGQVFTAEDIEEANAIAESHFGPGIFNYDGWCRLFEKHGGTLPLRIKAAPEGLAVPTGNVLMTVENTDEEFPWLTNYFESLLTHIWYPCTVATKSYFMKKIFAEMLELTSDSIAGIDFMLHDFGFRGATTSEAAALGGAGHLVNFKGTDTLVAMQLAHEIYGAPYETLAFSVPASEHSVMTALGQEGEMEIVDDMIEQYPTGILSVVADSYNIYEFVRDLAYRKDKIEARDGVFVVRPDSLTEEHTTPEELVGWIANQLYSDFGGEVNSKGYKVLNDSVRILWGDGIDSDGIEKILRHLASIGFSSENFVFGMGGGLLQKVNRDTQRFAFKCSAQKRGGVWYDIQKNPLDESKASKAGRLALIYPGLYDAPETILESDLHHKDQNILQTVFENGEIRKTYSFDEIRSHASQVALPSVI